MLILFCNFLPNYLTEEQVTSDTYQGLVTEKIFVTSKYNSFNLVAFIYELQQLLHANVIIRESYSNENLSDNLP